MAQSNCSAENKYRIRHPVVSTLGTNLIALEMTKEFAYKLLWQINALEEGELYEGLLSAYHCAIERDKIGL